MADVKQFPYVSPNGTGENASLAPFLPLKLSRGEQSEVILGLLDTGASVNVLPFSLGTALGVEWKDELATISLTGNLARLPAQPLVLQAEIEGFTPVRLAFAWTQSDGHPVILGQVNFFMEFDVCFFRARSFFEVRPRESRPQPF
jgi:hypothetical protein